MRKGIVFIIISIAVMSCTAKSGSENLKEKPSPIKGTWKLISGTLIEKGDTAVTYYTNNISFIKIINDTHFAFLQHDVAKGKDSAASFSAGGGRYTLLKDSLYTEYLEYCSARDWEGNEFKFTVKVRNDTLIQSGIEKVENAGIERLNIEKYIRLKD
jgi:hypothetical protein